MIVIELNAWFSDNDTERRNSKVSQDGENIIILIMIMLLEFVPV